MRRLRFAVLVLLGALLLAGGLRLVPKLDEEVAMLARDGYAETALKKAELVAQRGQDPRRLTQIYRLRAHQGDLDGAIEALRRLAAAEPGNAAALDTLGQLLAVKGDLTGMLDAVLGATEAQRTGERVNRLAALYRLHGRYDDELERLLGFAEYGTALLATDYQRLGALLAARGDWERAKRWLRAAEQNSPIENGEVRLLLLEALLRSGRRLEAVEAARGWLTRWNNAFMAAKLVSIAVKARDETAASDLFKMVAGTMPDRLAEVVDALGATPALARESIPDPRRRVDPSEARRATVAARGRGEPAEPFEKLAHAAREGLAEATAVWAEAIVLSYGAAALGPQRALMTEPVLVARPLFAAELMAYESKADLARWFLLKVDPITLSAEDQERWTALVRRLEGDAVLIDRVVKARRGRPIPEVLARHIAQDAFVMQPAPIRDLIANRLASTTREPTARR